MQGVRTAGGSRSNHQLPLDFENEPKDSGSYCINQHVAIGERTTFPS